MDMYPDNLLSVQYTVVLASDGYACAVQRSTALNTSCMHLVAHEPGPRSDTILHEADYIISRSILKRKQGDNLG